MTRRCPRRRHLQRLVRQTHRDQPRRGALRLGRDRRRARPDRERARAHAVPGPRLRRSVRLLLHLADGRRRPRARQPAAGRDDQHSADHGQRIAAHAWALSAAPRREPPLEILELALLRAAGLLLHQPAELNPLLSLTMRRI